MQQPRLLSISAIFLLVTVLFISQTKLISHPQQPDPGYVNDPDPGGALTCASSGCHSGTAIADSTMFTVKMGLFSAGTGAQTNVVSGLTTYYADSAYYVTVTGTGNAPRYGFELTVVDNAASPGNMAGVIANIGNTITIGTYQPSGSTLRQYAGHKNASTTKVWTFKWTAPHTGVGPLTIYYCGMNSNSNNGTSGDVVYKSTRVIAEASLVSGIEGIESKLSSLLIYPSIFNSDFNLAFNLNQNSQVKAALITLNGTLVSQLMNEQISSGSFNRSFQIPDLAAGVYLVKLQIGNSAVVKKIVKL